MLCILQHPTYYKPAFSATHDNITLSCVVCILISDSDFQLQNPVFELVIESELFCCVVVYRVECGYAD